MDRRLKMKVKIFERSGEPGRLEREINDFLATLGARRRPEYTNRDCRGSQ